MGKSKSKPPLVSSKPARKEGLRLGAQEATLLRELGELVEADGSAPLAIFTALAGALGKGVDAKGQLEDLEPPQPVRFRGLYARPCRLATLPAGSAAA